MNEDNLTRLGDRNIKSFNIVLYSYLYVSNVFHKKILMNSSKSLRKKLEKYIKNISRRGNLSPVDIYKNYVQPLP